MPRFSWRHFSAVIAQVSCSTGGMDEEFREGSYSGIVRGVHRSRLAKCGLIGVCACGAALSSPFSMTGHSEPTCYVCCESFPEYHFPEHRVPSTDFFGHSGTAFSEKGMREAIDRLKPLFTGQVPVENPPKIPERIQWVQRKLVCEVAFCGMDGRRAVTPNNISLMA
jgi:hypothetical protein